MLRVEKNSKQIFKTKLKGLDNYEEDKSTNPTVVLLLFLEINAKNKF